MACMVFLLFYYYFENTKETNPAEFSPVTIQNKLKKKRIFKLFQE